MATEETKLSGRLRQLLSLVGLGLYQPGQTNRMPGSPRPTYMRVSKGRQRHVRYPLSMHVEKFDTAAERNERFHTLRASKTARDVCKGFDVDKWYVAWNGKAA